MRHLGQAELDAGDVLGDCFDAHAERLRRVEQACAVHVHGQALRARMRQSAAHPRQAPQDMSFIMCIASTLLSWAVE
jgi:hypothetical protein